MEPNASKNTDKFAKAHIKVRSLQDAMADELKIEPTTTNAELAEILWPWLTKQSVDNQKEVFAYAISHIRPVVNRKINPPKKRSKKVTDEQAAKMLQQYNAKKMMEFTYELLDAAIGIGPKLQAKMKPGQRVKDVWTERQVVNMMRSN